ncbi:MAG: hypothetical protein ACRENB_16195 [Gemmatimonadales bacterium]
MAFEDEGVEEGLGGALLVGIELGQGLELEPELLVGPPLALVEQEGVARDLERLGQLAEDVERGWEVPAS